MSPVFSQLGFKQESSWGTAVTVDKFFEFDSESLALDQQYYDGQGLRADTMFTPINRMRQTTRMGGGDITMDVPTKGFGAILNLLHSATVTPTQIATTTAYLQTHPIGTTLPSRSATLQVDKKLAVAAGTSLAYTYPGAVITAINWNLDNAGVLKTTISWDVKDETTPATTPAGAALASASYLSGATTWTGVQMAALTVGGSPLGLAKSINMTLTFPYATGTDRTALGSATHSVPIPNGRPTLTGEVVADFTDATSYADWRAATTRAIILQMQGAVIEGANKEEIKFNIPAAQLRGSSPSVQGEDLLSVTIPFVTGFDGTNAPLTVTYVSTETSL